LLKKFYAVVGIIIVLAFSVDAVIDSLPNQSISVNAADYQETSLDELGFEMNLDMRTSLPSIVFDTATLCKVHGDTEIEARAEFVNFAGLGKVTITYAEPLVSIVVLGHKKYVEKRGAEYITRTIPAGYGGIPNGYVWELVPLTADDLGPGEYRVVATAVFSLDLEPPYNWIRVVSNTFILTVCSNGF
jgi:hypothetical protein